MDPVTRHWTPDGDAKCLALQSEGKKDVGNPVHRTEGVLTVVDVTTAPLDLAGTTACAAYMLLIVWLVCLSHDTTMHNPSSLLIGPTLLGHHRARGLTAAVHWPRVHTPQDDATAPSLLGACWLCELMT
jgi:hypothetical protein